MNCKNCPLNIDSNCFKAEMVSKIPLHFRNIFLCNNDYACNTPNNSLCSRDLWVLSFIAQKEKFAMANAVNTMENLVKKGLSELLCYLFENAPYEKRREMWLKMTKEHVNQLYMFDSLFEKECLAPLCDGNNDEEMHKYQNTILFPQMAMLA
jgi:hypothetical protein